MLYNETNQKMLAQTALQAKPKHAKTGGYNYGWLVQIANVESVGVER